MPRECWPWPLVENDTCVGRKRSIFCYVQMSTVSIIIGNRVRRGANHHVSFGWVRLGSGPSSVLKSRSQHGSGNNWKLVPIGREDEILIVAVLWRHPQANPPFQHLMRRNFTQSKIKEIKSDFGQGTRRPGAHMKRPRLTVAAPSALSIRIKFIMPFIGADLKSSFQVPPSFLHLYLATFSYGL